MIVKWILFLYTNLFWPNSKRLRYFWTTHVRYSFQIGMRITMAITSLNELQVQIFVKISSQAWALVIFILRLFQYDEAYTICLQHHLNHFNFDWTILFVVKGYKSIFIWARSYENMPDTICEQQRRRSACASAQSDQRLCCSLLG